MSEPKNVMPCSCGRLPTIHRDTTGRRWEVICLDCYDGAEDSPNRHEFGSDENLWFAVDEWNECQEDEFDE